MANEIKRIRLENTDFSIRDDRIDNGIVLTDTIIIDALEYTPEDQSNKVAAWSQNVSDTKYPSEKLVKDTCDNIREVAEGKCKTVTASTLDIVDPTNYTNYLKYDGTEFTSSAELSTYINGLSNCNNTQFIKQDNFITTVGTYVLFNVPGMDTKHYVIRASELDHFLKTGDIILLTTVEVPDRWYQDNDGSGNGLFYKLETSKVNLDDYVLKNEPITPGTNCKITYDAKGLVTAGAALEASDIPDNISADKLIDGTSNHVFTVSDDEKLAGIADNATAVSVSASGTSTEEVKYITINGSEKKLAGSGGSINWDVRISGSTDPSWNSPLSKAAATWNVPNSAILDWNAQ